MIQALIELPKFNFLTTFPGPRSTYKAQTLTLLQALTVKMLVHNIANQLILSTS